MAKRKRKPPPPADRRDPADHPTGSTASTDAASRYASRGGLKLAAALEAFGIDPAGQTAADLGCSTGGFVDCWLQHGCDRVFAVDTAYGELAWALRQDPRVTVMERTNALHAPLPWPPPAPPADPVDAEAGRSLDLAAGLADAAKPRVGVDWVSIDLGWTKQDKAIPAALRWLPPPSSLASRFASQTVDDTGMNCPAGSADSGAARHAPAGGIITLIKPHYESGRHQLTDEEADAETARVAESVLPGLGVVVHGWIRSPIRGGKGGNLEHLALLTPAPPFSEHSIVHGLSRKAKLSSSGG